MFAVLPQGNDQPLSTKWMKTSKKSIRAPSTIDPQCIPQIEEKSFNVQTVVQQHPLGEPNVPINLHRSNSSQEYQISIKNSVNDSSYLRVFQEFEEKFI